MKDVISVDTILQGHREWMRGIRTDHLIGTSHKETKEALYSLLISKLPEEATESETLGKDYKGYSRGWNSAIDDIKTVLDEMFGVGG